MYSEITKKIEGIPNDIFSLTISVKISNFNVSRVLIDGGFSYDIIYSYIFKKMWLNKEKLSPCVVSDLQAFDGIITCSCGYIELNHLGRRKGCQNY